MSALIIHQRNALVCYTTDRDVAETISLPKGAVTDMEVLDEKMYIQSIAQKLGTRSDHQSIPTMLVLADDLCFTVKASSEKLEEQKQKLIGSIPFVHVETVMLKDADTSFIVATNADLYETAVRALSESGYMASLVVPWNAIVRAKLSQGGEIDKVTVKRIFDAQSSLKMTSFPLAVHEQFHEEPVKDDKQKVKPAISRGILIFGGIAFLYAIGMLWFMLRK